MTTSNTEKQGGRQAPQNIGKCPPEKIAQAAPGLKGRIFHGPGTRADNIFHDRRQMPVQAARPKGKRASPFAFRSNLQRTPGAPESSGGLATTSDMGRRGPGRPASGWSAQGMAAVEAWMMSWLSGLCQTVSW